MKNYLTYAYILSMIVVTLVSSKIDNKYNGNWVKVQIE